MRSSVAQIAKGNEVFLGIVTEPTSRLHMMHLKAAWRPTGLTAPSIAPQNLFMQDLIRLLIQLEPRAFGADRVHKVTRTLSKNSCLLGSGRESKSRSKDIMRASELPFSRFAPARKSAQIISSV